MTQETPDVLGVVRERGTGKFAIRGIGQKYDKVWAYLWTFPREAFLHSWADWPWSGGTLDTPHTEKLKTFMETHYPEDTWERDPKKE